MTTPSTIFLPGHAQLSTRADVIADRDAISPALGGSHAVGWSFVTEHLPLPA